MRREFLLPEQDTEYLSSLGLQWETLRDGNIQWLLIHDYSVPLGYTSDKVIMAFIIDPGYPVSQIDMVYFYPALNKLDGSIIGALAVQSVCGISYQRWSRHRTGENPWRPGIDDLSTQISLVNYWLEREHNKV